jgi:protein TonB
VGALGIPVPTVSLDVQLGAAAAQTPDQTPTVTVFDTPPTPPPPPQPAVEVPRVPEVPMLRVRELEVPVPGIRRLAEPPTRELAVTRSPDGELIGYRLEPAVPETAVDPQQVPEPEFTPMTVRPTLTNAAEVSSALMREYPAVLRDAGIGGAPVVWVYITETGTVGATQIHESSGFEALDEAAMNVARVMVFTPAKNGDDIVATWVQIPIRFQVVN